MSQSAHGRAYSRSTPRLVAPVLGVVLSVVLAAPARSDDALTAYRELARARSGSALIACARAAMEARSAGEAAASATDPACALPWPAAPVAVYVTLTRGAETRACVGRPASSAPSLGETVAALAADALTADRRHPPVRLEELETLRVVIAFTDEGEVIADPYAVDPGRDGLLVSSPRGVVAFLPGEARTIRWALREARRIGVLRDRALDTTYRRLAVVTMSEAPALIVRPVHEGSADAPH